MTNMDKYKKIFMDIFDVREEELNENFNFNDIGKWDSLIHLTLIEELESAFDIIFESDDIIHYGGYVNGLKILTKYGVDFEG